MSPTSILPSCSCEEILIGYYTLFFQYRMTSWFRKLHFQESCEGQCNAVGIKAADEDESSVEQYDCFKFHVERDFSGTVFNRRVSYDLH